MGVTDNRSFAVKISDDVKDIATGGNFNLILRSDGTLWGVGSNQSGQLGLGNLGELNSLTKIADNVESIAANSSQSFFITKDGKLFAMGWKLYWAVRKWIRTRYFDTLTNSDCHRFR